MMNEKIIFIHIPKTAGSSFAGILESRFAPEKRFHVAAGSITSAKRYYEITNGILDELDDRIIKNSELIYGHMPFALNERLQSFCPITFLRQPVNRVVSDYFYTRSTPTNPLHHIVRDMSLKDYVCEHKELHLDNLQTRIITGKMSGALNNTDLKSAESNLFEKFVFYGLSEYFVHSLALLNHRLRWQVTNYTVKNVTKVNREDTISESDLEVVRQYNALDLQLYERAKGRFLDLIEGQRDLFDSEVKKLKRIDLPSKPSSAKKFLREFRRLIK